jgi:hypothetical protein
MFYPRALKDQINIPLLRSSSTSGVFPTLTRAAMLMDLFLLLGDVRTFSTLQPIWLWRDKIRDVAYGRWRKLKPL